MKFLKGLAISGLVHALLFFGGMEFVAWEKARANAVMEIDLRSSSVLLRPKRTSSRAALAPTEPWYLSLGKRSLPITPKTPIPAPMPQPEEQTATGSEQPAAAPAVNWLPAAAASRVPEWVDGMITEDDYPAAARKQGKEGKVVATVAIDSTGSVRDVQITEASYPEFNELVLERLKKSRWRPGRDQNDQPIAVRMSIPIVFELH